MPESAPGGLIDIPSVWCWRLHRVDDEDLERIASIFEFQSQLFLRSCLRRSLTLYGALTRMGYPARIHFGVRKQGPSFLGHSWVTLYGRPLAETDAPDVFTTVYSYPLSADR